MINTTMETKVNYRLERILRIVHTYGAFTKGVLAFKDMMKIFFLNDNMLNEHLRSNFKPRLTPASDKKHQTFE